MIIILSRLFRYWLLVITDYNYLLLSNDWLQCKLLVTIAWFVGLGNLLVAGLGFRVWFAGLWFFVGSDGLSRRPIRERRFRNRAVPLGFPTKCCGIS